MSKYTTEVRFICENQSGLGESAGSSQINTILKASAPKIFDFDFPIFDESYRNTLEIKILKHYYTREIGFETVGLWKHWLDKRLNEIMPYYNQMYSSTLYEFNPFYDVDLTTDSNRKINHDETGTSQNKQDSTGNANSSSSSTRTDDLRDSRTSAHEGKDAETHEDHDTGNSNSTTYQLYSDTPQNGLSGVENQNYLTNATKTTVSGSTQNDSNGSSNGSNSSTDTSSGTQTGTVTNTTTATNGTTGTVNTDGNTTRKYDNLDDYLEHVKGKRGGDSYSKLLLEYRKTFLNIDMMIIEELSDLFMNVW